MEFSSRLDLIVKSRPLKDTKGYLHFQNLVEVYNKPSQ